MALDRAIIDRLIADVGEEAAPSLVRLFLTESRDQVASIEAALAVGKIREAGRLAHSLKHAARGFGLPDLGILAQRLQENIDAGKRSEAEAALAVLKTQMPGEIAELEALLAAMG